MNVVCKIFNFFLNMFAAVLSVVVEAASMLIGAAFTVLDELTSSVLSSPLAVAVGLGLLWFLVGRSKDKDDKRGAPA